MKDQQYIPATEIKRTIGKLNKQDKLKINGNFSRKIKIGSGFHD